MKYKNTIALSLAAALVASGASAQGIADGVEVEGFIDLSYIHTSGFDDVLLSGDLTIGTQFGGGPFGVALGIEGYAVEGDSLHALYATLTYQSDFGAFSVGRPRFVFDTLVDVPALAGNQLFAADEEALGTRSYAGLIVLFEDVDFAGLRYDGDYGDLRVSAAYHRLWDATADADAFSVGLGYRIGPTELIAGVETLRGSGASATNYFVGVTYEEGRLDAGLLYSTLREDDGDSLDTLSLWTGYEVIDGLTVTGSFRSFPGEDYRLFGIGAEYTLASGAYVGVGVATENSPGGTDQAFNLNVGYRF